ncbi:hypothetical protein ACA910_008786 [Epithemia clementina (nom. ined.)]
MIDCHSCMRNDSVSVDIENVEYKETFGENQWNSDGIPPTTLSTDGDDYNTDDEEKYHDVQPHQYDSVILAGFHQPGLKMQFQFKAGEMVQEQLVVEDEGLQQEEEQHEYQSEQEKEDDESRELKVNRSIALITHGVESFELIKLNSRMKEKYQKWRAAKLLRRRSVGSKTSDESSKATNSTATTGSDSSSKSAKSGTGRKSISSSATGSIGSAMNKSHKSHRSHESSSSGSKSNTKIESCRSNRNNLPEGASAITTANHDEESKTPEHKLKRKTSQSKSSSSSTCSSNKKTNKKAEHGKLQQRTIGIFCQGESVELIKLNQRSKKRLLGCIEERKKRFLKASVVPIKQQ